MPDRVLDQVRDHLSHQLAVAVGDQAWVDSAQQPLLPFLSGWFVDLDHGGQHLREVEFGKGKLLRPGFDLRDSQQGAEGLQNGIGVGDGPIDGGLVLGSGTRFDAHILKSLVQMREWRTKIVGNVVGDLPHPLDQQFDPVQHVVQTRCQPVELVATAMDGNPLREIAGYDRAAGRADRIDPPKQPGAHDRSPYQGEHESSENGCTKSTDQQLLELGDLIGVNADQQQLTIGEPHSTSSYQVRLAARLARWTDFKIDPADLKWNAGQVSGQPITARIL